MSAAIIPIDVDSPSESPEGEPEGDLASPGDGGKEIAAVESWDDGVKPKSDFKPPGGGPKTAVKAAPWEQNTTEEDGEKPQQEQEQPGAKPRKPKPNGPPKPPPQFRNTGPPPPRAHPGSPPPSTRPGSPPPRTRPGPPHGPYHPPPAYRPAYPSPPGPYSRPAPPRSYEDQGYSHPPRSATGRISRSGSVGSSEPARSYHNDEQFGSELHTLRRRLRDAESHRDHAINYGKQREKFFADEHRKFEADGLHKGQLLRKKDDRIRELEDRLTKLNTRGRELTAKHKKLNAEHEKIKTDWEKLEGKSRGLREELNKLQLEKERSGGWKKSGPPPPSQPTILQRGDAYNSYKEKIANQQNPYGTVHQVAEVERMNADQLRGAYAELNRAYWRLKTESKANKERADAYTRLHAMYNDLELHLEESQTVNMNLQQENLSVRQNYGVLYSQFQLLAAQKDKTTAGTQTTAETTVVAPPTPTQINSVAMKEGRWIPYTPGGSAALPAVALPPTEEFTLPDVADNPNFSAGAQPLPQQSEENPNFLAASLAAAGTPLEKGVLEGGTEKGAGESEVPPVTKIV